MKKILFLSIFTPTLLVGCTGESFENAINGSWKVISFMDLNTGIPEFKNSENSWNRDITIKFDAFSNPKSFRGINISNEILGKFEIIGNYRFKVSELFSTEVGQPEWADRFLNALVEHELTYQVNSNLLIFYYDNKSKAIYLKRTF
ncbi:MAG: hypothetical protein J5I59_09420 [Saprospiraceae bacterium]|nr:hypothetical protein [Saprospiraceae bacterium]